MRKKLLFIAALVIWALFIYGCFAFVSMEANPATWHEGKRIMYVLIGPVMGIWIAAGIFIID